MVWGTGSIVVAKKCEGHFLDPREGPTVDTIPDCRFVGLHNDLLLFVAKYTRSCKRQSLSTSKRAEMWATARGPGDLATGPRPESLTTKGGRNRCEVATRLRVRLVNVEVQEASRSDKRDCSRKNKRPQLISRSLSSTTALYLLSVHDSFKKRKEKKNRKKSRVGCCGSTRSVVHMTSPCTTRFSSLESLEHGHSVLVVEDGKKQE
jgi:hypothetical protein